MCTILDFFQYIFSSFWRYIAFLLLLYLSFKAMIYMLMEFRVILRGYQKNNYESQFRRNTEKQEKL